MVMVWINNNMGVVKMKNQNKILNKKKRARRKMKKIIMRRR